MLIRAKEGLLIIVSFNSAGLVQHKILRKTTEPTTTTMMDALIRRREGCLIIVSLPVVSIPPANRTHMT